MTPLETLQQISVDCAEPNWDHEGAEPVHRHTIGVATGFLVTMHGRFAIHHVVPTVDGGIMLAADAEETCTLTIKTSILWPAPSETRDGNDQPGD